MMALPGEAAAEQLAGGGRLAGLSRTQRRRWLRRRAFRRLAEWAAAGEQKVRDERRRVQVQVDGPRRELPCLLFQGLSMFQTVANWIVSTVYTFLTLVRIYTGRVDSSRVAPKRSPGTQPPKTWIPPSGDQAAEVGKPLPPSVPCRGQGPAA